MIESKREVRSLIVMPQLHPYVTHLNTTIDGLKMAVSIGNYDICDVASRKIANNIYVIYNREHYFSDADANRRIGNTIIIGVFYVIAVDDDYRPRSMTEWELQHYSAMFWDSEYYSNIDIAESNFCEFERNVLNS